MPITTLFAVASNVIIDSHTNQLSLIEVLETIDALTFPLLIPNFTVVWVKRREASDPPTMLCELQIWRKNEKRASFPINIDFQNSSVHRSIAKLTSIVIGEPGEIELRMMHNALICATMTIPIHAISPATTKIDVAAPIATPRKVVRKRKP